MERAIVRLDTDVPVIVHLDQGPEGKETTSPKSGKTQYQYTLNGDACVMWIDPQCRDALIRSGARAGDDVQFVKLGNGKTTSYDVQVVTAGEAAAPAARPAVRQTMPLPASAYYQPTLAGNGAAPAPAQAIERQARTAQYVTRELKTASVGAPTQPAPEQPRQAEVHPITEQLAKCLRSAIDACKQAQDYAREQQFGIQFTSEDVRAIGLSVYIGQQRNGGGR